MRFNIDMEFEVNFLSEKNFFDSLVLATKELFQEQATGAFVGRLLEGIDKRVCDGMVAESGGRELGPDESSPCCRAPKLRRYRRDSKKISSSVGKIPYDWNRLRCLNCKATVVPLREILTLKKYQSETREFQKLACETIAEQSYRRSCGHLTQIGGILIDRMQLHRIIARADADTINPHVRGKGIVYLMADGTGFPEKNGKKSEKKEKAEPGASEEPVSIFKPEKERKSDLKIVLGLTLKNEIVPVGIWAKCGWKHVADQIEKANNHPKIKPKPIANILLCDGEKSLIDSMGKIADEIQRCQWHLTYEFFHLMRYQERCGTELSRELTAALHKTIQIERPVANDPESKLRLEVLIRDAEKSLDAVIKDLRERNFLIAAVYVENAKKNLFTFLRHWIETDELPPKVTSKIERLMREVGRRVKKIGFNWGAKGVARIARIVLKIIARKKFWDDEWRGKLGLEAKELAEDAAINGTPWVAAAGSELIIPHRPGALDSFRFVAAKKAEILPNRIASPGSVVVVDYWPNGKINSVSISKTGTSFVHNGTEIPVGTSVTLDSEGRLLGVNSRKRDLGKRPDSRRNSN